MKGLETSALHVMPEAETIRFRQDAAAAISADVTSLDCRDVCKSQLIFLATNNRTISISACTVPEAIAT